MLKREDGNSLMGLHVMVMLMAYVSGAFSIALGHKLSEHFAKCFQITYPIVGTIIFCGMITLVIIFTFVHNKIVKENMAEKEGNES